MRIGDVRVGFGGEPVRPSDELLGLLDGAAIGRDSELRVLRGTGSLRSRLVPATSRPGRKGTR